jgi:transcriptional regulator with XRE-family HTH domain
MTTTQQVHPADVRVVPDWELCDRMRRSLRLVPGLDGSEVGELMGVRRETVSTWLSGRRRPSNAVLFLWSDMTGVDRDWLLTGTPSDEWYAIRDSNPEPADLEPARPALRILGGESRPRPVTVKPRMTRNLRAVS